MFAKDYRFAARTALKGKWGVAVAVCLIAAVLTGALSIPYDPEAAEMLNLPMPDYWNLLPAGVLAIISRYNAVIGLISFILGGAITLGSARFHTNLVKGEDAKFTDLFSRFDILFKGIWVDLVLGVFILMWSFLYIIPGIIAAYRYAMVPYLIAEFPDLSVMDAIRESSRLMRGRKWRLFCLGLSFIGWYFLCL